MKMAVLWDVTSCSLVDIIRRFRDAYCNHTDNGSNKLLRNVQPVCTRLHSVPGDSHIVLFSYKKIEYYAEV
jgi:hypothetical protein